MNINIITAIISFFVTALLGVIVIPMLRRLKFGQTILDIGPAWHKSKQGTPTMGGITFIAGITLGFAVGAVLLWRGEKIQLDFLGKMNFVRAVSGLVMAILFGFVGFLDDFIKIRKKQNEGLTPMQKILFQVLIVAAYFTTRIMSGDTNTSIVFPLLGTLDLWYFYYVVMGLGIIYMVNAVNLTDGVDGLCSGVSVVYFAVFTVICSLLGFSELSLLSIAAGAGCIGFLIWNFKPAKVFMGDTGSLFLGGLVCAVGVGSGCEVLMVIAGGVYVWEALTVLIQTTYYKITGGKRLFKMTPIHHSFEKRGWAEQKIFVVFCGIGAVLGVLAIFLLQTR